MAYGFYQRSEVCHWYTRSWIWFVHDFLAQYRSKEADPISSTCVIQLPFPVKPDFDEQAIIFDDSDTQLYLGIQKRSTVPRLSVCILTDLKQMQQLVILLQLESPNE